MMGPRVPEGSRGAPKDQIMRSNRGSGRPNYALQKGAGKWYMAMTRPYPSHTPKSGIRPKNLSDDSYVSEIKKLKNGGLMGLLG
jgi:hypothetical protein